MAYPSGFHPVLKRQLIREQLEYVFQYPLTLVVAAMGYGKTVAVKDFINGMQAEHVWLDVESDETPAHIMWESLTRQLAASKPEIGDPLKALGVPVVDIGAYEYFPNLPVLGEFLRVLVEEGEIDEAVAEILLAYVDNAQAALDRDQDQRAISILKRMVRQVWELVDDTEMAELIERKILVVIRQL